MLWLHSLALETNPHTPTYAKMSSYISMFRRSEQDDDEGRSSMETDLIIVFLAICFGTMISVGALYSVRKYRYAQSVALQNETLPQYNSKGSRGVSLSIDPPSYSRSSYYDEKTPTNGLSSPRSPTSPTSPVPEIRITFPDEMDEQGRHMQGRVVIVKIGEKGAVGLEPCEQLPKYERDGKQWDELDMDLIGGLKEKEKKEYL